jgi:hypothetical protein
VAEVYCSNVVNLQVPRYGHFQTTVFKIKIGGLGDNHLDLLSEASYTLEIICQFMVAVKRSLPRLRVTS